MVDVNDSGKPRDLHTILSGDGRDFLIRNNGGQVKINDLGNRIVGLYFSALWCAPCTKFTPKLAAAYAELSLQGHNFEIILISRDRTEEEFNAYFSNMPWLAIPFGDSTVRSRLTELFNIDEIPHLVVLDADCNVIMSDGAVELIRDRGAKAYPFSLEEIKRCREEKEAIRRKQTLQSLLASPSRDYLVSKDGSKVLISDLEGKVVCLYFCLRNHKPCSEFTPKLIQLYNMLMERREGIEVVYMCMNSTKSCFELEFKHMPWLAIPFEDERRDDLSYYFELTSIPTLVVIGRDGKTWHTNAVEFVEGYGVEAYPFLLKFAEFLEKEKAREEAQTIESLLTCGELDYVIGKDGEKVPVSSLSGRNLLLYFSSSGSRRCRNFHPKLLEAYHKIKEKDHGLEVILICKENSHESYNEFLASMPWLALPFQDKRVYSLERKFSFCSVPHLVAIGSGGKTVCKEAKELVAVHGAEAYPFTEERVEKLKANGEENKGFVCDEFTCRSVV